MMTVTKVLPKHEHNEDHVTKERLEAAYSLTTHRTPPATVYLRTKQSTLTKFGQRARSGLPFSINAVLSTG